MNTIAKSNLNVRIDAGIKERAGALLTRMGIDHTTAIEMFYRQIINENQLPFTPKPVMSLEDQLRVAVWAKNPKVTKLNTDGNGNVLIDKDKDPDLYDWAVNG